MQIVRVEGAKEMTLEVKSDNGTVPSEIEAVRVSFEMRRKQVSVGVNEVAEAVQNFVCTWEPKSQVNLFQTLGAFCIYISPSG